MSLIAELKRRNVFRVGVAYGVVAWLLLEVASVVLPALRLPEWTLTFLVFFVIAGLPLALIIAWAFELTSEGLKRESAVDADKSVRQLTGRKLDFIIIAALTVAVVYFAVDKFVLDGESPSVRESAEQSPGGTPAAHDRSIAVLPFANRSADEADAFFVDGMHDDILTHLSKIRSLKVISRTSVMEYRDTKKNVKTIGEELGAAAILEGGVQRAGTQIRVNVQLIDAETDEHLWADIYDRQLTAANVFAIQTEIATAIADALRATLSTDEREDLKAVPTENMVALEAYFLGKQLMTTRGSADLIEAADHFNRAIALDSNFALAYVGLADSYLLQIEYSKKSLNEMLPKAQAAAEKALALDDRLAEAYTSLGAIAHDRNDYEASDAAFKRSLELNPNYVTAYHWYALLLGGPLGRRAEALELIQKAAELDPRAPVILQNLGGFLGSMGRFEESLAWFQKAIEIDPNSSIGYGAFATHYRMVKGQLDEAARWRWKTASVDPGNPNNFAALCWLFLDLGDSDRAAHWIERAIALAPAGFNSNLTMQMFQLYRGDPAAALEYGRRAFEIEHYWAYEFDSLDPDLIHEIKAGRYREARAVVETIAPELLNEDSPEIGERNYKVAIDLALILSKLGERERADLLLERSLQYIQRIPRLGGNGYGVADVQIHTLRGDKQKALSALQQAIDEGWRANWWYYLQYEPTLELLHDDPEYQAMIEEIEADMSAQLERVREMERNGELAPIPDLAAA